MNLLVDDIGLRAPPATIAGVRPVPALEEGHSVLRQYARIALRWRWVILSAVVGMAILGMLITFLMTPVYTATSTIEISREADQVTEFRGVAREASVADQEFYQTQYGLLRSRSLAERVAVQLRLVDDPAFFELFGEMDDTSAFALTDNRFQASGRDERQRKAGEVLLDNLAVNPTRLSRLVDIAFTSPDPNFSTKVTNAWAVNFIETNLERKTQATSYGREALGKQLAEYKSRLDESQRQLVAYASREQIINLPAQTSEQGGSNQERSIVADDLAAMNAALTGATADRIAAEATYRQAGGAGQSPAALSNQAINLLRQKRAELAAEYQQMLVRFEPGYPAAQALKSQIDQLDGAIAREENRVAGSIRANYQQALAREQSLSRRVAQLKNSYLDLRRRSIQYNIFQQEVDTNRALYDGLLQRFKEIGVAGGVGVNNILIVDLADVPQKPSSPRIMLNLLLSLVAGLILGAVLAFIMEQMDEAIADPSEVERRLGLALLGTVPKVENSPEEELQDRKSDIVDAYLAVQTNLGFTTEHGVPRSFMITSTRPSEGKSTTALALATMLARSRRKVVLVDGDMRSPSIHQLAGVNHDHGLSNYLVGEELGDKLLFEIESLGIHAMTAGPIPPNAAELLIGSRFTTLLDKLLEMYDHVVIDSPPVMGLADAPLIASHVEGVVFVLESHGIRSTLVKTAVGRLRSANARIFGAVLTKFESRRAQYGYDYGYNYGRTENTSAVG